MDGFRKEDAALRFRPVLPGTKQFINHTGKRYHFGVRVKFIPFLAGINNEIARGF